MDNGIWKYCTPGQCQEFILSLNLLPEKCRESMSREKQLACLYALGNHAERQYHEACIPKGAGSRKLLVPGGLLKSVQKNILHHCLDGRSVSPCATAYRRGVGLRDNAAPHAGCGADADRQVLKLDISHFFDHILFPRVIGAAFPGVLYPPAAAGLLAHLCCYYDRLPQGAPTSPAISNLVMKPFDDFMEEWCRERKIVYTRYCDDMTFSGKMDVKEVYRRAEGFLEAMGFSLNRRKTRVLHAGMRQTVTGIVVNDRPRVPAPYKEGLRQEIYYCRRYGVREHLLRSGRMQIQDEPHVREMAYMNSVLGRIGYVLQIEPENREFMEYRQLWQQLVRTEGSAAV